MNTEFTKGPWVARGVTPSRIYGMVREDKEAMVAATGSVNSQSSANAHLIAAAPDMYAMIKEVADMQKQWYGYGMDTHIKLAKMAKKMELILTKARGEIT